MDFGRDDYNTSIISIIKESDPNEPVFLFRASDAIAPRVLLQYATEVRLSGRSNSKEIADSIVNQAQKMIEWQSKNGTSEVDINNNDRIIADKDCISSYINDIEINHTLPQDDLYNLSELMYKCYGGGSLLILLSNELMQPDNTDTVYLNGYNIPNRYKNDLDKSKVVLLVDNHYKTIDIINKKL